MSCRDIGASQRSHTSADATWQFFKKAIATLPTRNSPSRPTFRGYGRCMNVSLRRAAKFRTMHCKFISFSMHYFFSKRRRGPNGQRYFPNNRQHLASIFRCVPRGSSRNTTRALRASLRCEFNYFRSATRPPAFPSFLYRKSNRKRIVARARVCVWRKRRCAPCAPVRNELSLSRLKFDETMLSYRTYRKQSRHRKREGRL